MFLLILTCHVHILYLLFEVKLYNFFQWIIVIYELISCWILQIRAVQLIAFDYERDIA